MTPSAEEPRSPSFSQNAGFPSSFAQNHPRHVSYWAKPVAASQGQVCGVAICGCGDREVTGVDMEEEGFLGREVGVRDDPEDKWIGKMSL